MSKVNWKAEIGGGGGDPPKKTQLQYFFNAFTKAHNLEYIKDFI